MSPPMEQSQYILRCGGLEQKKRKRQEWRPSATQSRRCKILIRTGLLALLLGQAYASSPRFEVGGNSDVRLGQKTSLTCNLVIKGVDPPALYVWVKDGEVIPGHRGKHLYLDSLTRQDAGYYQCGTVDPGSYGQGIHLRVYIPGDRVARPVIFPNGIAVLGHPFYLRCRFLEGYVKSEMTVYTWFKDTVEVEGQNGETLNFDSVKEEDEGRYTCAAREGPLNTTSPQSPPSDVEPLVPPQVRMKPPGPVVKGVRGENLTLTCNVTRALPGVPVDGYSWSYLPSPKDTERQLEGKTPTLTLGPLTLEDRGQYLCQARNDKRPEHSSLNLTGHASVTVDVLYLDNLTLTPDLEVNEGDRVTLTCAVDSLPTAQLAWTVRGEEVRHVTDNMDHYVISRAACSDSGSYTCVASNTELPGRDRHATLQLIVNCTQVPASEIIETEVGANFHFPLPDWTPMVVVHPGGHDVISVGQDCSYNVLPAFQSRCLQPRCDSIRHRLSFTLTHVTEEDEGEYLCLEQGPRRTPILNCSRILHIRKHITGTLKTDHPSSVVIAVASCLCLLVIVVGVLLGTVLRRRHCILASMFCRNGVDRENVHLHEETIPMNTLPESLLHQGDRVGKKTKEKKNHTFNELYKNGNVYIFQSPITAMEGTKSISEEEAVDESTPLHSVPRWKLSTEQNKFDVKNLITNTLQNSMALRENDLPSFILHITRPGKRENVMFVLDRKFGLIVMIVKAICNLRNLHPIKRAARHLLEAKETVSQRLLGLVKSATVRAVLCLPCLTHDEADDLRQRLKILRSNADIDLLAGKDPQDFRKWVERLEAENDREIWLSSSLQESSPDSVYEKVANTFLTLEDVAWPTDTTNGPQPAQSLLLTSAQVEVRDSTARHLHIWGPPGSGKTTLLVHRARQWLAEGYNVILAVGDQSSDILLQEISTALRKGFQKEARNRIRVCLTFYEIGRAVNDVLFQCPGADICVIIDMLRDTSLLRQLFPDVIRARVSHVWSTGWEDLHSGSTDFSREALELAWECIHLPDCMQCTDNTVELLSKLGHGVFPEIPSCSASHDQNIPAWRVVDHCLHPDHKNTMSCCVSCKEEMSTALPSMDQDLRWEDWVALHTGDSNIVLGAEVVQTALKSSGVPVCYDSTAHLRHETVVAGSASRQVTSASDFVCFQQRVIEGVDEDGQPTLHLLRVEDFKGLEREGVILVHWDERDNDPKCQSQGDRDTRLGEHRHQWIQAASRSTGQVILLLLSPSPARSLLDLPEPVMP